MSVRDTGAGIDPAFLCCSRISACRAKDGLALIRKVRSLEPARGGHVPAAALTAYTQAEDRSEALLAGFQLYLAKPVEPAELTVAVARLAGRMN